MRRLINLKDEAHYGFYNLSTQDVTAAFRQTRKLIEFAREVLAR